MPLMSIDIAGSWLCYHAIQKNENSLTKKLQNKKAKNAIRPQSDEHPGSQRLDLSQQTKQSIISM